MKKITAMATLTRGVGVFLVLIVGSEEIRGFGGAPHMTTVPRELAQNLSRATWRLKPYSQAFEGEIKFEECRKNRFPSFLIKRKDFFHHLEGPPSRWFRYKVLFKTLGIDFFSSLLEEKLKKSLRSS